MEAHHSPGQSTTSTRGSSLRGTGFCLAPPTRIRRLRLAPSKRLDERRTIRSAAGADFARGIGAGSPCTCLPCSRLLAWPNSLTMRATTACAVCHDRNSRHPLSHKARVCRRERPTHFSQASATTTPIVSHADRQTCRRSMDWPVIAAMRSKSLSTCNTVSRAISAVAAISRSGIDSDRCWPRSASSI